MHSTHRRRAVRTVTVAALAAALLTACSGGSDTDSSSAKPDTEKSPQKSAAPKLTPAEKVIAPLLDRKAVDVATLPLPAFPGGSNPASWKSNARSVRAVAVAAQKKSLWTTPAGPKALAVVAAAAPPQIRDSMNGRELAAAGKIVSLYFAPSFAKGAQPTRATVVDARWASAPPTAGYPTLGPLAVLETTTVYTFDDRPAVVVQRQFKLATERTGPDVGAFLWAGDVKVGGHDACRLWTDGQIVPSDSPDLNQLNKVVNHVVAQTVVDSTYTDESDIAKERKKACA